MRRGAVAVGAMVTQAKQPPAQGTTTSTLLRDHPGWLSTADGRAWRAFRSGDSIWTASCHTRSADLEPTVEAFRVDEDSDVRLRVDRADPTRLRLTVPDYMLRPLLARGPVHRVRNPDLWDALVAAVIRQHDRETNANRMYRTLCETYGETVTTIDGPALLLPRPERVLGLTDGVFSGVGIRHKRSVLRAVAKAYLTHNADWAGLWPYELLTELQKVPYIGEWTASLVVSDITNDFSFYPFAQHAIRIWGDEFAVAFRQPREDTEFARLWRTLRGEQLSVLTQLTMAWGMYHGDSTELWHSRWWRGRWHGRWIWE
jgi:DNA-3-methyladenine glycosylase II